MHITTVPLADPWQISVCGERVWEGSGDLAEWAAPRCAEKAVHRGKGGSVVLKALAYGMVALTLAWTVNRVAAAMIGG